MLSGRSSRIPVDRQAVTAPRGQVYVFPPRLKECLFRIDLCPNDVLILCIETDAKGHRYPVVSSGNGAEPRAEGS
jgi:hypothetical protein